jgi:hypothetical protein
MLPLVAPLPQICQLALPSASASCYILFLSALASCCVFSCQPATLQPPSSIASPTHGWLLRLLPAPSSLIAVARPLLMLCHCLPFGLSRASRPAGCGVASAHAAASHLPASPTLIVPFFFVVPWPSMPLVWLVVALPPPLILLVLPCLLMHHLHLPPHICLLLSLAGCLVPSPLPPILLTRNHLCRAIPLSRQQCPPLVLLAASACHPVDCVGLSSHLVHHHVNHVGP